MRCKNFKFSCLILNLMNHHHQTYCILIIRTMIKIWGGKKDGHSYLIKESAVKESLDSKKIYK